MQEYRIQLPHTLLHKHDTYTRMTYKMIRTAFSVCFRANGSYRFLDCGVRVCTWVVNGSNCEIKMSKPPKFEIAIYSVFAVLIACLRNLQRKAKYLLRNVVCTQRVAVDCCSWQLPCKIETRNNA